MTSSSGSASARQRRLDPRSRGRAGPRPRTGRAPPAQRPAAPRSLQGAGGTGRVASRDAREQLAAAGHRRERIVRGQRRGLGRRLGVAPLREQRLGERHARPPERGWRASTLSELRLAGGALAGLVQGRAQHEARGRGGIGLAPLSSATTASASLSAGQERGRVGQHGGGVAWVLAHTALELLDRLLHGTLRALQLRQMQPRKVAAAADGRGVAARRVAHLDAALQQTGRDLMLTQRDRRQRLLENEVGEAGKAREPLAGASQRILLTAAEPQGPDHPAHQRRRERVAVEVRELLEYAPRSARTPRAPRRHLRRPRARSRG